MTDAAAPCIGFANGCHCPGCMGAAPAPVASAAPATDTLCARLDEEAARHKLRHITLSHEAAAMIRSQRAQIEAQAQELAELRADKARLVQAGDEAHAAYNAASARAGANAMRAARLRELLFTQLRARATPGSASSDAALNDYIDAALAKVQR